MIEWPANTRLDGQQKRKDRSWLSSWAIDRWSGGLGIDRQNVDVAADTYRLWDTENVDTRYPSQIVLSPEFVTCTINPSMGDLELALQHLDDLYFVRTTDGTLMLGISGMPAAKIYEFIPPNILGSPVNLATVFNAAGGSSAVGSVIAVQSFGRKVGFLCWGGGGGGGANTPTNRFAWAATIGGLISGSNLESAPNLGVTPIDRFSHISDLTGTLHILEKRNNDTVGFWVGNRDFGALSEVASLGAVIGSYLAPLQNNGVNMYAYLPEGIYDFDATPDKIIDTSRAKDKNLSQVMFGNNLYFKNKKSLLKYVDPIDSVGYDLEDGLPSDKWGEITAMTSSWKYIFAAVKGATYSHILTKDKYDAWQYYARMPSAGMWVREIFLSDSPDGYDRLWCIYGNHYQPGYFLNPMVNPLQAGTYSFVPTGHFTKPIFDGGMSEENGAFYDMVVTADKINTANKITALYGLNGAEAVTTLGVVGTTLETLVFGSPYGVEGYRIQPKFMLTGSPAGTTPVFREATIHYLKDPSKREAFDFTIDLEQSAYSEVKPTEALIGTLNALRDKRTLFPFWYGQIGTKAVKVLDIPSDETVEEDKIYPGEREGEVRLRVAEIL